MLDFPMPPTRSHAVPGASIAFFFFQAEDGIRDLYVLEFRRVLFRSDWYTFKNESQDGYDTVEWAAALPYSNGKVGMFGGSYVGATQYLAAIAKPPHLAGICPTRSEERRVGKECRCGGWAGRGREKQC